MGFALLFGYTTSLGGASDAVVCVEFFESLLSKWSVAEHSSEMIKGLLTASKTSFFVRPPSKKLQIAEMMTELSLRTKATVVIQAKGPFTNVNSMAWGTYVKVNIVITTPALIGSSVGSRL